MAKKGWLRAVALVAVLLLVGAACGDDDGDDTATATTESDGTTTTSEGTTTSAPGAVGASVDGQLKLGAIMPLTGDLADYGPGMQAAVELAVDDINAAGGVLDQEVTLESADDATDADTANTAASRLVGTVNVDAVMGAAASGVTIAGVVEPVTGSGRLQCTGSATGALLTGISPLFFRTAPSDVFQGQLAADTVAADGHGTVAIIYRADDYGEGLADAFDAAVTDAGVEVVESVAVDPEGTNFDADVQTVIDSDPDAIMVVAFPEEGASILTAMIEQGFGPADKAVYATDGLASDELPAAVDPEDPNVLDGIKGTRPGTAEEPVAFNERLQTEKGVSEVTFAAAFYDCTILTALAAVAAGTDDPEVMAEEIVGLTAGDTQCSSFEECKAALDSGSTITYVGQTQFVLSEDREPSEGLYEVWEFTDGALEVLATETISKES